MPSSWYCTPVLIALHWESNIRFSDLPTDLVASLTTTTTLCAPTDRLDAYHHHTHTNIPIASMGKAGRIACITTPMVLTIASLIALAFVEVSGWSKGSPLNNNYMMSVNFSNFSAADAESGILTEALKQAKEKNILEDQYRVYLWSYCTADKSDNNMDWCSKKQSGFVFDPVDLFQLNSTSTAAAATGTSSSDNAVTSAINDAKDAFDSKKDDILGDTASGALKVYKKVAKWNFWAYQIAFWTTVITIVVGLLAICSRWGSLCTWIMAVVSLITIPHEHFRKTKANFDVRSPPSLPSSPVSPRPSCSQLFQAP